MRAVLLLSCPEQKGIVATVSDFIYRNDGNIVADQHTDFEGNLFLQRIEWELDGVERVVLARAVRLHLRHRLLVDGNRTVVFD
jgi:formyltetrahydrofolate hydrolase